MSEASSQQGETSNRPPRKKEQYWLAHYRKCVSDWPYSTFHRYVAKGIYPENWCGDVDLDVEGGD